MTTGTLPTPDATIHYKLRGDGPLLLMVGGGYSNADTLDQLADQLTSHYTVLTHDRRGQTRSPMADFTTAPTIAAHADDLHHLLTAIAGEPVHVYGCSIGALITLELTARHPEQVYSLIAHEPPATYLLPQPLRQQTIADGDDVEESYAAGGAMAALAQFGKLVGFDPTDREPETVFEDPRERIADLEFFLTHDAPAVGRHRLDLTALKQATASTRILPVSGEKSGRLWVRQCTIELAAVLGLPWHEVPGTHNGDMFRPKQFAARLRELLEF